MIGKSFAHYEITEQIGVGGMGAVYRARDTKLDRDVAIKVIPPAMSDDPERIARFQREAKTLASLQHPNIASIYGFEEIDGVRFLVMELVEGMDLSVHLKDGALAEHDAVEIIRQVASGLNEAHRSGIVHRDLKPANVMLTPDGTVKVLDFGLARAATPDGSSINDPVLSPTITAAMTQAGTILGTAAYMAPEQARGKAVDHRADIWALGTILYELLTGQRLFVGETTTDVLASVIKVAPELDELPADTSLSVRRMLRRCLQRDPRRRLDSAADVVLELDDDETPAAIMATGPVGRILPWAAAVVLGAFLIFTWLRPAPATGPVFRQQYDLAMPDFVESNSAYKPVASPDGRWIAVALLDSLRTQRVMLHSLETGTRIFVENSDGGNFPFWSPDSRFLGFFHEGGLSKLHLESGTVEIITTDIEFSPRGGTWSTEGKILFAPGSNTGLALVDAAGGPVIAVTSVDSTMVDGSDRWPRFLPDGNRFIFTKWSNVQTGRAGKGGIFLGSLDGTVSRQLLRDLSGAEISTDGSLFFQRNGRLMAVDFGLKSGSVSGEPLLVSDSVGFRDSNGQLCMSANSFGQVFYCEHNPNEGLRLRWIGRDGQPVDDFGQDLPLTLGLDLSPDGLHYATEILDEEGSVQVWIGDVERESFARLSRFENDCWGATFSPDGREALYGVQGATGTGLYRHLISGAKAAEMIIGFDNNHEYATAGHWFAQDQVLVSRPDYQTGTTGIMLLDLQSETLTEVLVAEFNQREARMSPDGRWLAYVSDESGIPEVYIRNWPELDNKWQVSREGGLSPHWREDGGEVTFRSIRQTEMRAVDFQVEQGEPTIGIPYLVTPLARGFRFTVLTSDHQKYLVGVSTADPELPPVRMLSNWRN